MATELLLSLASVYAYDVVNSIKNVMGSGLQEKKEEERLKWAVCVVEKNRKKVLEHRRTQKYFRKKRKLIARLQAHIRGFLVRLETKEKIAEMAKKRIQNVIAAQAILRGFLARRIYQQWKTSVRVIENRRRAHMLGEKQRAEYLKTRDAIIFAQSLARAKLAKNTVFVLRKEREQLRNNAATKVQSVWKMYSTKKQYQMIQRNIIQVQSHIRRYLIQTQYTKNLQSIKYLQVYWKNLLHTRKVHAEYIKIRNAFRTIKNQLLNWVYRRRYLLVKRVFMRVAALARGYLARKHSSEQTQQARKRIQQADSNPNNSIRNKADKTLRRLSKGGRSTDLFCAIYKIARSSEIAARLLLDSNLVPYLLEILSYSRYSDSESVMWILQIFIGFFRTDTKPIQLEVLLTKDFLKINMDIMIAFRQIDQITIRSLATFDIYMTLSAEPDIRSLLRENLERLNSLKKIIIFASKDYFGKMHRLELDSSDREALGKNIDLCNDLFDRINVFLSDNHYDPFAKRLGISALPLATTGAKQAAPLKSILKPSSAFVTATNTSGVHDPDSSSVSSSTTSSVSSSPIYDPRYNPINRCSMDSNFSSDHADVENISVVNGNGYPQSHHRHVINMPSNSKYATPTGSVMKSALKFPGSATPSSPTITNKTHAPSLFHQHDHNESEGKSVTFGKLHY